MRTAIIVLLVLFSFSLSAPSVLAKETPESIILPADFVHEGDYFAAGEIVEIAGVVTGDAYIVGAEVTISGEVQGDLLIAGGRVYLEGAVGSDVRIIAGQLRISGEVGGNTSVIAGDVTADARLMQNTIVVSGEALSDASILGDLTVVSGSMRLRGSVGGDVRALVDTIHLSPTASVSGNLTYWSDEEVTLDESIVGGDLSHIQMTEKATDSLSTYKGITPFEASFDIFRLFLLLSSGTVGWLLIHFFPNYSQRAVMMLEQRGSMSFIGGVATLAGLPVVSGILAISVVGLPLAFIGFTAFGFLLYFSQILFAYWLGTRFLHGLSRTGGRTVTYLVGVGLYYVLTSITLVSTLLTILAVIFGSGAILLAEQKTYLSARKLKVL